MSKEAIKALEEALAKQEQSCPECVFGVCHCKQEQGEPEWYHVIDVHGCNRFYHRTETCPYDLKTPLYTTPQQRKPLNREQRVAVAAAWRDGNGTVSELISLVEAAHGIKE